MQRMFSTCWLDCLMQIRYILYHNPFQMMTHDDKKYIMVNIVKQNDCRVVHWVRVVINYTQLCRHCVFHMRYYAGSDMEVMLV